MSDTDPIAPDSPLGRALSGDGVPDLPSDFADRILARTKDRPAPLPETRRGNGGVRRWRSARRLGIAVVASGALASAAAATGLLDNLPIDLPTPQEVWGSITGQEPEPATAPQPSMPANMVESIPEVAPQSDAPIEIVGPIDTPEELEEAFRRVDQVRASRKEIRRGNVDRRIDNVIEQRREQGLPVPTPEQEERLRGKVNRFRERIETRADERIEGRREQMRERVEAGEALTPEQFLREQRPETLTPQQRQRMQQLRNLPPAERRARIREWREQRRLRDQQRLERELESEIQADEETPAEPPAQEPPEADPEKM